MREDLQAVVHRENKKFILELELAQVREQLQQLGAAASRSHRLEVGSRGAARGGFVVSDGLVVK